MSLSWEASLPDTQLPCPPPLLPSHVPQEQRQKMLHLGLPGARSSPGMCGLFLAGVFIFVPMCTLCTVSHGSLLVNAQDY